MKYITKISILFMVIMFSGLVTYAQKTEKEKFKVYGKCEMCAERIEEAAEAVEGVESASWDMLSKKIKVKYDPAQVKLIEIHEAIAEVGHDTDRVRADDETYENLHHCCHYERKELKMKQ